MKGGHFSIELSDQPGVPMHRKINEAIREKISRGEWLPGEKIPSENQFAAQLGVSRMTINRPLRELTMQGLLRRVHGMGTFVAEPPRQASLIEIRSIADEITARGKRHSARVLRLAKVNSSADCARQMGVDCGAELFHVELVHSQDALPIQHESRYVNPALVPGFLDVDFSAITPTDFLIKQLRPDQLEHVVQAILPDAEVAAQLSIPENEPCLRLRRRTWKSGAVVTVVEMIYPSSRYDLVARNLPLPAGQH